MIAFCLVPKAIVSGQDSWGKQVKRFMASQFTDILLSENEKALFLSWQYSDNVPSAHAMHGKMVLFLNEGKSISETAKLLSFSRVTVYKWLNRYISGNPDWYKGRSRRPHHIPLMLNESKERDIISEANALIYSDCKPSAKGIQSKFLKCQTRSPSKTTINRIIKEAHVKGLILQPPNRYNLDPHIQQTLKAIARNRSAPNYLAKRAKMVLLSAEGNSTSFIAKHLKSSGSIVERWLRQFSQHGVEGLCTKKPVKNRKDQDEFIKSQVFSLLHSPPIEYGINRTSWRISDLKNCLGKRGLIISETAIRKVVKSGGYKWRKARKVLTSPDPDYRNKLEKVKESSIYSKKQ